MREWGKSLLMSAAGRGRGRGGGGRGARWRAGCSCTAGTKLAHQYTVLVLSSALWKIDASSLMNNLTSACVSCIDSTWQASKPYMISPIVRYPCLSQDPLRPEAGARRLPDPWPGARPMRGGAGGECTGWSCKRSFAKLEVSQSWNGEGPY